MLVISDRTMVDLTEQELQSLYAWIDEVPLSRPKKSIARDFSDGVMAAEIVHHFFPRLVEMHNYSAANSTSQKIENWKLLNRKVFNKLDVNVPDELLHSVVACKPGVIEYILDHLKSKIEHFQKSIGLGDEINPIFGGISEHYSFSSTAGNTVANRLQDDRHSVVSPTSPHHTGQRQSSINLPPVVKSQQHVSKLVKPSHIPRPSVNGEGTPTHSRKLLPPIGSQTNVTRDAMWNTSATNSNIPVQSGSKLPVMSKDRGKSVKGIQSKTSKRDLNYAGQHLGVASHWFRKPSNTKDGSMGGAALSKDGMLVMAEKDQMIMELQETVQLLQMKVKRLEHLIKIKDYKLQDIEKRTSNLTKPSGQPPR